MILSLIFIFYVIPLLLTIDLIIIDLRKEPSYVIEVITAVVLGLIPILNIILIFFTLTDLSAKDKELYIKYSLFKFLFKKIKL